MHLFIGQIVWSIFNASNVDRNIEIFVQKQLSSQVLPQWNHWANKKASAPSAAAGKTSNPPTLWASLTFGALKWLWPPPNHRLSTTHLWNPSLPHKPQHNKSPLSPPFLGTAPPCCTQQTLHSSAQPNWISPPSCPPSLALNTELETTLSFPAEWWRSRQRRSNPARRHWNELRGHQSHPPIAKVH